MTKVILSVEDSEVVISILETCFPPPEYKFLRAKNLAEARAHLDSETVDLILIDMQLPDGSGIGLQNEIIKNEKHRHTPVIFLSMDGAIENKVLAFSQGADDYLTKPFNTIELKARVESKLRKKKFENQMIIKKGPIEIHSKQQKVYINTDDKTKPIQINLTSREYRLLLQFASAEGAVLSRSALLENVSNGESAVTDRVIDVHISNLRKKLGPCGDFIQSVPREGYRFDSKPLKKSA